MGVLEKITVLFEAKDAGVQKYMDQFASKQTTLAHHATKLGTSMSNLDKGLASQNILWEKGTGFVDTYGNRITNLSKRMKKAAVDTKRFRMEYLSLLFAGMAVQRMTSNILRSTLSTFTKIMESNQQFGTAVQRLGVHWEYLKYTIGSAINTVLEPLMPILLNIFDRVVDFVQQNPDLVFWSLAGALAAATATVIIAQFGLLVGGLEKIAAAGTGLSTVSGALSTISKLGGLYIVFEGFKDLLGGDMWSGLSQILIGFGLYSASPFIVSAGLMLGLIGAFKGEKWDISTALAMIIGSGYVGWMIGGPYGAYAGIAFGLIFSGFFAGGKKQLATTVGGAGLGAAAGATLGGLVGSVVPGPGTAAGILTGAKIGGILGGLFGGYTGYKIGSDGSIEIPLKPTYDPKTQTLTDEFGNKFSMTMDQVQKRWGDFNLTVTKDSTNLSTILSGTDKSLGSSIAKDNPGSYPLVYSLGLAETAWGSMKEVAIQNIKLIIEDLNRIPREIVTIHKIVTVYEKRER